MPRLEPGTKERKDLQYNLGAQIAKARKEHKFTQEQLAEQMNVSRQAISHWENGDSLPNYEMLVRLMDVLHMTAEELLPSRKDR